MTLGPSRGIQFYSYYMCIHYRAHILKGLYLAWLPHIAAWAGAVPHDGTCNWALALGFAAGFPTGPHHPFRSLTCTSVISTCDTYYASVSFYLPLLPQGHEEIGPYPPRVLQDQSQAGYPWETGNLNTQPELPQRLPQGAQDWVMETPEGWREGLLG